MPAPPPGQARVRANATPAIATNASATIPSTSSVPLACPGRSVVLPPGPAGAVDVPAERATDDSFTPSASASLPTAASVALNSPAPPGPIGIPASARYPAICRVAGPVEPEPVRHHDQQPLLVGQRQLEPQEAGVLARVVPQPGHRSKIERAGDDRHPDRKPRPRGRFQQRSQLDLLLDRQTGV